MAVLKYKSGGTWYDLTVGMDQSASDARYVLKSGDTMTNHLTINRTGGSSQVRLNGSGDTGVYWVTTDQFLTPYQGGSLCITNGAISAFQPLFIADPTLPNHAASKNYSDSAAGSKRYTAGSIVATAIPSGGPGPTRLAIGVDVASPAATWGTPSNTVVMPWDGFYIASVTTEMSTVTANTMRWFLDVRRVSGTISNVTGCVGRSSFGVGEGMTTTTTLFYAAPAASIEFAIYQNSPSTVNCTGGYWHIKYLGG